MRLVPLLGVVSGSSQHNPELGIQTASFHLGFEIEDTECLHAIR